MVPQCKQAGVWSRKIVSKVLSKHYATNISMMSRNPHPKDWLRAPLRSVSSLLPESEDLQLICFYTCTSTLSCNVSKLMIH